MRASTLIGEILKGCGVSDNAAKAMETVSEQLLGHGDRGAIVEVNDSVDAEIKGFYVDSFGDLCLKIEVKKEDLE